MLKRTNRAEALGMVRSCIIIPECMTFERCVRDRWFVDWEVRGDVWSLDLRHDVVLAIPGEFI